MEQKWGRALSRTEEQHKIEENSMKIWLNWNFEFSKKKKKLSKYYFDRGWLLQVALAPTGTPGSTSSIVGWIHSANYLMLVKVLLNVSANQYNNELSFYICGS